MKYILAIAIVLILAGCHKKQTALEYEQAVIYEVFPALIDSLYPTPYSYLPPPPPPIPEEENRTHADSVKISQVLAEHEKLQARLKSDSVELVVAIADSTYTLEPINKNELIKHFTTLNLSPDTTDISSAYKIDLNKLKNHKKIHFKYRSEFSKYDYKPSEIIGFSRIRFDSTKTYGVFRSDVYCGKLCAQGTRIFIRKAKGQWVIDRIEVIYVA